LPSKIQGCLGSQGKLFLVIGLAVAGACPILIRVASAFIVCSDFYQSWNQKTEIKKPSLESVPKNHGLKAKKDPTRKTIVV